MGTQNHLRWNTLSALLLLAGCGGAARLPVATGFGPTPELPAPSGSLIPLVHVAPATGWKSGVMPTPAAGLAVNAFATGLDHPRWLYLLPNGDVLVAETNAPSKPDDSKGIRGWFMNKLMKKAGAETPSANRITLLRDADGDGVAELQTHFLIGLHSPFGMALIDSTLYVANSDALRRFTYHRGDTVINSPGVKVLDLPAGSINHHWTKNIIASEDHRKLYITIGSNSNAAENGMAVEAGRAEIMEYDIATGATRVFASGLRNANGMSWQPESHALWTSVNERDEIGSDLVPDYMTSVQDGGFYGWPYSYYGQHLDTRVKPQRPDLVARAIVPDYALGAHTASLSMVFYDDSLFPHSFWGGAFVGQHGSWNRKPFSGYQVLFVPFTHGKPSGAMQPILTAFVDSTGHARGRPVGVAVDSHGALLVADDVGNVVWRVRPDRPQM